MSEHIEQVILHNILLSEDFTRKVLPYVKEDYFDDDVEKGIYKVIYSFFEKFGKLPTVEAISIEISKEQLSEADTERADEYLVSLRKKIEPPDEQWLLDETEKFCLDKSTWIGLSESIAIYKGQDKKRDKGAIPQIITEAISVSFDQKIGHDFVDDADARYDFLHRQSYKIPFDLEKLNEITKGGIERKTLNLIMGGTASGKTILSCHLAGHYLTMGLNVLYITLEMAEEKICQRIDMNLLGLDSDQLQALPRDVFKRKIEKLKETTKGKLIVKEYPTGGAHVGHFRHLAHELRLKKNFIPDIIIVDYVNICASSRLKRSAGSAETSSFVKSIAEELRAWAIEMNAPVWSPTQFNRDGFENTDPSLKDIGESWGLAQTADFIINLVPSSSLAKLKQIMIKQGKNRYYDEASNGRFILGLDKDKMKFYNVEASAQLGLDDMEAGEVSEHDEKLAISKKHGSEAHKPAYSIKRFGKDKDKFKDIKVV